MKPFRENILMRQDKEQFEIVTQNGRGGGIAAATVTISLFNYKECIVGCLESVKSQTIYDLDLLVVDDCSTDSSLEVARKWVCENGGRFRNCMLIHHKINRGLPTARNTGVSNARTEYVFVLDADNLLYPRCLERLVTALDHCSASFAYCYLEKFEKEIYLQNVKPWNPATLKYGNTIDAMVLLRKCVWEQVGGYSTNMPAMGWEDFDLWFKIAKVGGWGILVPEILARYRVHRSSMLYTVTNPNADMLWAYLRSNHPQLF
jgi:glycosyltransferase involved in cell wall biosynthesis